MTPEQRAVLQQALAALQSVRAAVRNLDLYESDIPGVGKNPFELTIEAISALRAELAKPDRVPLTRAQVQTIVERKHFRVGYVLSTSDKTLLAWYRQGLRDGEAEHGIRGDKSW
jgi:hypothetical protein